MFIWWGCVLKEWWGWFVLEYRVSYDSVADALYIRVRDDRVADSLEVDSGLIVDFNKRGEVVGVEILNYSKSNVDLDRVVREGLETLIPAR
jgi:uncharacterized protein YuzE